MPLPGLYSLLNDLKFRLVCETALSLRKRCSTIGSTPFRSLTASRIAILNGRGSCSDSNTFSSDAAESSASRFDVESFSSSRRKSWSSSSTYLEKTAFILSSPSERDISEPVSALDVGKVESTQWQIMTIYMLSCLGVFPLPLSLAVDNWRYFKQVF